MWSLAGRRLAGEDPARHRRRLHAETLAVPAVQERLATFGVEQMPMTVDEFGKFYRDDVAAIVNRAKDVNLVPSN